MIRAAAGLCLLTTFGLALGACSGDAKKAEEDPNLFPKYYRDEILFSLSRELEDPTNVRESGITEPVLRTAGREQRYAVCVRYNARNVNRQYTGVKERIAYFYAGHLNQLVHADQGQCKDAVYKPWPELEKHCLAKNCA